MKRLWIARDKDNSVWVYRNKPERKSFSFCPSDFGEGTLALDSEAYPELTWENSPKELIITES